MINYENIKEIKDYMNTLRLDKSPHTITSYSSAINRFFGFLGIVSFHDVAEITPDSCREYQLHLKEIEGLQFSSINANTRPLKTLFNWLVENDYLQISPFDKIKYLKEPKKEKAFLTEKEIEGMMMAATRLEDKVILAILITTGLRRSELVNLKLSDYRDCHVQVMGKGKKQRTLILQNSVCQLLNHYISKRRNRKPSNLNEPWLFCSKNGGQFTGEAIRAKVKNALRRSGIDEERLKSLSTHTLRHTFTANLFESGADVRVAQAALGHANLATTQIYAHVRNSALDRAMLNQKEIL